MDKLKKLKGDFAESAGWCLVAAAARAVVGSGLGLGAAAVHNFLNADLAPYHSSKTACDFWAEFKDPVELPAERTWEEDEINNSDDLNLTISQKQRLCEESRIKLEEIQAAQAERFELEKSASLKQADTEIMRSR